METKRTHTGRTTRKSHSCFVFVASPSVCSFVRECFMWWLGGVYVCTHCIRCWTPNNEQWTLNNIQSANIYILHYFIIWSAEQKRKNQQCLRLSVVSRESGKCILVRPSNALHRVYTVHAIHPNIADRTFRIYELATIQDSALCEYLMPCNVPAFGSSAFM